MKNRLEVARGEGGDWVKWGKGCKGTNFQVQNKSVMGF